MNNSGSLFSVKYPPTQIFLGSHGVSPAGYRELLQMLCLQAPRGGAASPLPDLRTCPGERWPPDQGYWVLAGCHSGAGLRARFPINQSHVDLSSERSSDKAGPCPGGVPGESSSLVSASSHKVQTGTMNPRAGLKINVSHTQLSVSSSESLTTWGYFPHPDLFLFSNTA